MEKRIYINLIQLVEHVDKNEVVWQNFDSLMEFSRTEDYEFSVREVSEYEAKNSAMLGTIRPESSCYVFNSNIDDNSGFEDLIDWSDGKDLLIIIDNELLLCIAPCDKHKVLAMKL